MIAYDAAKPLISLHIAKCAGHTFRPVLEKLFKNRSFIHYFLQNNSPPLKHPLKPGICIHGHFIKTRKSGVQDYYPEVDQFITVLRDPLEAAISNYFYWKTKARARQLKNRMITPGGDHDYGNIDDFFCKRPKSNMLDFMPWEMTRENYKEILETKFVWIGLVENLQTHVDKLAEALGVAAVTMERLNTSQRDEELSKTLRRNFIGNSPLEFEICRHVQQTILSKGTRDA